MAIKKKHREDPTIELSAFADVAFLLIIFFILTVSLIRPEGEEVAMPSTEEPKTKKAEDKNPTVALVRDTMQYGESEDKMDDVTIGELRAKLYKMDLPSKSEKEKMIVVNVGEDVPYQRYYEVVTVVSAAGGVVALMEEVEQ